MIHWRWISLRLVVSKLRSVEPQGSMGSGEEDENREDTH